MAFNGRLQLMPTRASSVARDHGARPEVARIFWDGLAEFASRSRISDRRRFDAF